MNKKGLLILCLVLAAVIAGASGLYNSLSDSVGMVGLATTPPETETSERVAATQCPADDPVRTTETQATEPPDYTAPDFTMLDWDGQEVTLGEFFGKPIVLNFWASWCGPCKMEMPDIQEYYEIYGEDVHFLIVNCTDGSRETVDTAKAFVESMEYTFPVYFDTSSMGAYLYGASSIPLTFFITGEGQLEAYYMGAMDADILRQGIDMIFSEAE